MPSSLSSNSKALRAAREFAQLIGESVNASISHAPVACSKWKDIGDYVGYIAHCKANGKPAPMLLNNGHYLYLHLLLGVRGEDRRLTTLKYQYRYQATPDKDSWIFRYEFEREPPPPYPYARRHLHVNATPANASVIKPFSETHLPTGKVSLEDVIRYLVIEQGVEPTSSNWEDALAASEEYFW